MCCLRYEDQTYKDLKKNLPHRKTRVGTMEGPGIVIDSKILTQLVLVRLDHNDEQVAIPVEELMDPDNCPEPGESQKKREQAAATVEDPLRGLSVKQVEERTGEQKQSKRRRGGRKHRSKHQQQDAFREIVQKEETVRTEEKESQDDGKPKKKRRRRRRRGTSGEQAVSSGEQANKPRRRRRRRKGQKSGDGASRPSGGESSGSEKNG